MLINKFVAVYWGPTGLAVVGQTQNFLNISSHVLTLGGSNAVVKKLAASGSQHERAALFKLAMLVLSGSYAALLAALFLFRSELPSVFFIPQVAPGMVLLVLAACLPFVAMYTLSLAVFNADRRMRDSIL